MDVHEIFDSTRRTGYLLTTILAIIAVFAFEIWTISQRSTSVFGVTGNTELEMWLQGIVDSTPGIGIQE